MIEGLTNLSRIMGIVCMASGLLTVIFAVLFIKINKHRSSYSFPVKEKGHRDYYKTRVLMQEEKTELLTGCYKELYKEINSDIGEEILCQIKNTKY